MPMPHRPIVPADASSLVVALLGLAHEGRLGLGELDRSAVEGLHDALDAILADRARRLLAYGGSLLIPTWAIVHYPPPTVHSSLQTVHSYPQRRTLLENRRSVGDKKGAAPARRPPAYPPRPRCCVCVRAGRRPTSRLSYTARPGPYIAAQTTVRRNHGSTHEPAGRVPRRQGILPPAHRGHDTACEWAARRIVE